MTGKQLRLIFSTLSLSFFGVSSITGHSLFPDFSWGDPPHSVLASKCEHLWVDGARNDPALECYLTAMPDRLCRVAEKEHLLWFIGRYEKGKTQFDAKLRGYLVGVQIGMQMPGSERANGQSEDTLRKHDRVVREQAAKLKQDVNFVKALKMRTLTDSKLTALFRSLASRGYVSEGDLGWFSPAWVTEAFDDTLKVRSICKPTA
ncbi:MAG: hypothetical protein GYA66_12770 [Phyllobacteriaceae bacterium]|nr:hypothetical protein [Phyllobacteriaceae bacterium]